MHAPIFFLNAAQNLNRIVAEHKYSSVVFMVDENTKKHCLPVIQKDLNFKIVTVEIPSGEQHKNLKTITKLWEDLTKLKIDRSSVLVNLGGGVLTDMGGFAAATFKRGIPFIHIPTTLLGQVDAALGGKTGINHMGIKNHIGLFTKPKAIIIDGEFLKTLEQRQVLNGFAEMLKYGLIADPELYHEMMTVDLKNVESLSPLLHKTIAIKEQIVSEDPYDQGSRKVLNFGHTMGHAFESYSLKHDKEPLLHGEAIALGMMAESYISHHKGMLPRRALIEIFQYLSIHYRYTFDKKAVPKLMEWILQDKKVVSKKILMVLPSDIGSVRIDQEVSEEEIRASIDYCIEQLNPVTSEASVKGAS